MARYINNLCYSKNPPYNCSLVQGFAPVDNRNPLVIICLLPSACIKIFTCYLIFRSPTGLLSTLQDLYYTVLLITFLFFLIDSETHGGVM